MRIAVRANDHPGALPPCPGPSAAVDFHRGLPGYAPTPLVDAPALAAAVGVDRVVVKDESSRFGLPAFKILGASWATYRALLDHLGLPAGTPMSDLAGAAVTLVTATDGNHGRAVAAMAHRLGTDARVLVPEGTSAARIEAIRDEGATCEVVPGTYDDAVGAAAELGRRHPDHVVVSDTSWPGYDKVPRWVVEGYTTIYAELGDLAPDVVLVPLGVGALGASAAQWYRCAGLPTRLVGVEPESADCVRASVAAGRLVEVPGPHRSIMAGLNCGRPSPEAWPWLSAGFAAFAAIDDDAARAGVRALAAAGVVSGESGAAGAGALLAAATVPGGAREVLGIDAGSCVLLLSTEGATDPRAWEAIVNG